MSQAEGYVPTQPSNSVTSVESSRPNVLDDAVVRGGASQLGGVGDDFDNQSSTSDIVISDRPITCTVVTSPPSPVSSVASTAYSPSKHSSTPTLPEGASSTSTTPTVPATSFVLHQSTGTRRSTRGRAEKRSLSADSVSSSQAQKKKSKYEPGSQRGRAKSSPASRSGRGRGGGPLSH
jgi:hypothetical protein